MEEKELIDVVVNFENKMFFVVSKEFIKGTKEAENAKATLAIIAYKAMNEGYRIFKKDEKGIKEIFPEIDYPNLLELIKQFNIEDKTSSIKR